MLRRTALVVSLLSCAAGCAESGGTTRDPGTPAATAPVAPPLPDRHELTDPLVAARIDAASGRVIAAPADAAAWLALGRVYHANWYPQLAATCYDRVVELDPASARGWFHLSAVRSELAEPDAALASLDRAIALSPSVTALRWRRGLLLLEQGGLAEAEAAFAKATDLQPFEPAGWFGLARVYLLTDRAAEAERLIVEKLLYGPHAGYARQLLVAAYRALGRIDEAEALIARGGPETPPPWQDDWTDEMLAARTGLQPVRLGAQILMSRGRYAEAVERLEMLIEHWPDDVELLNDLGVAQARGGDPSAALRTLARALDVRRDHPVTLANLALAEMLRGTAGSNDEALALVRRSLSINPGSARAHEILGQIHFHAHRYDEAAAAFREALRLDARNTGLLVTIGRCQIGSRRWADAAKTFQEALARDTGIGESHLGLGIARMEMNDLEGAASSFDAASLTLAPGSPDRQALARYRAILARRERRP